MKASEIQALLDEPACSHNKKEKSGCAKPKPGATAGNLLVHPSLEGKNLIDATDSDGKFFIKEILEKRTGVIVYPWLDKSSDTPRSREKIVIFDEYKSWNWIIASGSYTDEIFSLAHHARDIMIIATIVLLALLLLRVPVFVTILAASLAYFLLTPAVPPTISAQRIAAALEAL